MMIKKMPYKLISMALVLACAFIGEAAACDSCEQPEYERHVVQHKKHMMRHKSHMRHHKGHTGRHTCTTGTCEKTSNCGCE